MGNWFNAGRIRPVAKGEWSSAANYAVLDYVIAPNGLKTYIATKDVPVGTPLDNTDYWQVLVDAASLEKRAADRLASPFSESSGIVTCHPVEDYPLEVKTAIEPVQAGSGDPYPGGGGKNLLENTATTTTTNGVTFTVNADGSVTVNGTATANIYFVVNNNLNLKTGDYILSGIASGGANTYLLQILKSDETTVRNITTGEAGFSLDSDLENAISRIVVFNGVSVSNITFYPMIRLATEIDATYAPYSNIRPITGFAGANLTRCGKNLIKPTLNSGNIFGASITHNGNGFYTINGTPTQNGVVIISEMTLPAGTYTLSYVVDSGSFSGSSTNRYIAQLVDADRNSVLVAAYTDIPYGTYTLTEAKRVYIRLYGAANRTYNGYKIAVQLENGNSASAYEPYQGNAFTVDFGQTVYGGNLDWGTGVLTIDRKCITLDGDPNILWRITSSGAATYTEEYISGAKIVGNYDIVGISSHTPVSETTGALYRGAIMCAYGGGKGLQLSLGYFGISNPTVASVNAYLAAQYADGTPVQICYELAEPITIQLTPHQILALRGTNTLYSDIGNTSVTGRIAPEWLNEQLKNAIIALGGNV